MSLMIYRITLNGRPGRAKGNPFEQSLRNRGRGDGQKIDSLEPRGARCNAILVTIHLQIKPCAQRIRRQPLGFIDAIGISTRRKIFRNTLHPPVSYRQPHATFTQENADPWWTYWIGWPHRTAFLRPSEDRDGRKNLAMVRRSQGFLEATGAGITGLPDLSVTNASSLPMRCVPAPSPPIELHCWRASESAPSGRLEAQSSTSLPG